MPFTIKQVADMTQLTPRTLRHYEEIGLLSSADRTHGNYRTYTGYHVVELLRIKRLTSLGFSLKQAKDILDDSNSEISVEALKHLAAALENQILETTARLEAVKELQATGCPPDISPDFAVVVDQLRRTYPETQAQTLATMHNDLVEALGDDTDRARFRSLNQRRVGNPDAPEFVALRELDTRFEKVVEATAEAELDALIDEYVAALEVVYSGLDQHFPSSVVQEAYTSLNSDVLNPNQAHVVDSVMRILRLRLAI
ncbi:MAG: MerR family transcriptional regulator [Propionibacteriaceae bacterium]|nr:MerR family transcriptional regulator [Propionibacteriaceae bacterium]